MQRDFDSSLLFNALYLSISDILLTHTHTHRTWCSKYFLNLYIRARGQPRKLQ